MNFQRWRDTGQRLQLGGHTIFYQQHGAGLTGLLLIHGFPTASWDWEAVWQPLCERFEHVIAPDLLGFGYSDKPALHDYSVIEQADLCEQLLQRLGVQRVHLFTHNYGDSVAQELLARYEERKGQGLRLMSVVLLNGGLFPEAHRPTLTQRLLDSPLGPLVARMIDERRFARAFSRVFGKATKPSAIELHDFWQLICASQGQRAMPRLIRYLDERRVRRERWVGALIRAQVPVRLISGPDDPVSGERMAARYQELVPNPDVVSLPGIGHYPQVEAADRVLRAFLDFHRKRVDPDHLP